jgi:hypothetical protein
MNMLMTVSVYTGWTASGKRTELRDTLECIEVSENTKFELEHHNHPCCSWSFMSDQSVQRASDDQQEPVTGASVASLYCCRFGPVSCFVIV